MDDQAKDDLLTKYANGEGYTASFTVPSPEITALYMAIAICSGLDIYVEYPIGEHKLQRIIDRLHERIDHQKRVERGIFLDSMRNVPGVYFAESRFQRRLRAHRLPE